MHAVWIMSLCGPSYTVGGLVGLGDLFSHQYCVQVIFISKILCSGEFHLTMRKESEIHGLN